MRTAPLITMPVNRQVPPGVKNSTEVAPWFKIENKANTKKKTKVYVYDAIGGWFGVDVREFINEISDIEDDEFDLHINSPGGAVFDGISIYNAIRQHDAEVTVYIDGLAASAASFIAQAGDTIIMARNAEMMIHDAIGLCMGNQADMLAVADRLDKVSDNIADIYAYNAGGETADWRELMRAETWYSAKEALAAGLVDEMLDPDKEDEEEDDEASNSWDLSKIFNYAGREFAPPPVNLTKERAVGNTPNKSLKNTDPETPEPGTAEGASKPTTEPASTPKEEPKPEPENKGGGNQAFQLIVNGSPVADMSRVQAHINALEEFRSDTMTNARVEFVKNLASDGKILASQVGDSAKDGQAASGLIGFALSLTPEQFDNWKDTFASAQSSPLFQNHGGSPESNEPINGATEDIDNEIATLENIVADHRRMGATQEQIENKTSYKRLQELKAQRAKG